MSLVLITPPAEEPITLTLARSQCSIDGTDHDSLLEVYITSTREQCEQELGRKLITQTVEQRLDAFPCGGIRLDGVPAQSIASVKYDDADGVEQTLAGSAYLLDAAAYPGGWLMPAANTEWPATADTINCVRIRYVCGFGAAADVPGPIRAWLLLAIAAHRQFSSPIDEQGRANALPNRFQERLLDPWRVY